MSPWGFDSTCLRMEHGCSSLLRPMMGRTFGLLLYKLWQVLTGLEALSLPSRNNAEEEGELRTQNGFRLSKYTWANRSLEHTRPLRGSSSACRVPLWSVRSCMWWTVPPSWNTLFVFTVALWDGIALPPLLPTVKQHYWGCPLLLSSAENYQCIRLLLLHWLANARRHAHAHTHTCTLKSQESNLGRDQIFYPTPQEK